MISDKKNRLTKFAVLFCTLQACAVFAAESASADASDGAGAPATETVSAPATAEKDAPATAEGAVPADDATEPDDATAPEPATEPEAVPTVEIVPVKPIPADEIVPVPDNATVPADEPSDRVRHEVTRYSYVGVALETLPAATYRENSQPGIQVVYVLKGSPADDAGLRVGDILVAFDGQKLFFPNQFSALVRSYTPGTEVAVEFWRNGKMYKVPVTVGERRIHVRKSRPRIDDFATDDIRLYVNGREFSFGEGSELGGWISVTPDGILIRDEIDIPAEFRRLVSRAHAKMPDSQRVISFLQKQYEDACNAAIGKTRQTFSQVFYGEGNSVVIVGDEHERRVTVSSADDGKVLFSGKCTTQEEIDAIPADAKAIIDSFTILRPMPVVPEDTATNNIPAEGEGTTNASADGNAAEPADAPATESAPAEKTDAK